MKDVFISFSSKETEEAERICEFLEKQGLKCFISTRDLVSGQEYAEQLLKNIDESNGVVLLLSRASNVSPHVLREVEYAVSHHTPVLVYVLEEVTLSKSMEYYLMTHQWITLGMDQKPKLLEGVRNLPAKEGDSSSGNFTVKGSEKKKISPVLLCAIIAAVAVILVGLLLFITKSMEKKTGNPSATEIVEILPDEGEDPIDTEVHDPEVSEITEPEQAGAIQVEPEKETITIYFPNIQLGDTVVYGTFYDTPITWRVIDRPSETTVTLLAKDILTMKIFDAAEGGKYNYYDGVDYWLFENHIITDPEIAILARGNNDWGTSNLRTWLNADRELVEYTDQAPDQNATERPYSIDPGFLFQFTEEEKAALVPVVHDDNSDLVYLLSSDELGLLKEAGMHIYAAPSDACKEFEDQSPFTSFLANYGGKTYRWWLRDNPDTDPNRAYFAESDWKPDTAFGDESVGACNYGVRPVVTIDLTKDVLQMP